VRWRRPSVSCRLRSRGSASNSSFTKEWFRRPRRCGGQRTELRIDRREPGAAPVLRLSLAQPGNPRDTVSGVVRLTLEGLRNGLVTRTSIGEISYDFRYFQNIEQELSVPPGVSPERVSVEVRPGGGRSRPVVQSVPWPR